MVLVTIAAAILTIGLFFLAMQKNKDIQKLQKEYDSLWTDHKLLIQEFEYIDRMRRHSHIDPKNQSPVLTMIVNWEAVEMFAKSKLWKVGTNRDPKRVALMNSVIIQSKTLIQQRTEHAATQAAFTTDEF
jgi:hypothetical protein